MPPAPSTFAFLRLARCLRPEWPRLVFELFIDRSIRAERVKFAVLSFTFLLLLAAFTSLLRDFHRVRSCEREGCQKPKGYGLVAHEGYRRTSDRKRSGAGLYEQAERLYHKDGAHQEKPVPMLVIATAGGG